MSKVVQLVNGILDFSEILVDTVPAYVTSTEITSDNIEDGRALVVALNGCIGKSATAKDAVESALEKITEKQRDMWDIIFPNLLERNPGALQENKIIFVAGRVDDRNGEIKIVADDAQEILVPRET